MLLKTSLIEAKARESEFVQRKSKLSGSRFTDLLVFSNGNLAETSLLEMSQEFEYCYGEKLTKQALDERFTDRATAFLKLLLQEVLSRHMLSDELQDLLPVCKTIRIKDATSFKLPKELQDIYPGSGGRTSKACLKIQFEYDLRTGKVYDLSIGPYIKNDLTDSRKTIESVKELDLLIRDLGYIGLEILEKIQEKGAFYLNRIRSDISIWVKKKDGSFVAIDLAKVEKQMRSSKIKTKEFSVYLGSKKRVSCRLIVECLPEDIKAEKLRKANRAAKREGRKLGQSTISRIGVNVFVTNLDEDDLPKKQVWYVYRLRWQIELIFKVWKSVASVNKVKKAKRERIESHLFGKLLWVFLGWGIYWKIVGQLENKKIAVSFNKMMKNFRAFCKHIKTGTLVKVDGAGCSIRIFVENVLSTCMLEKKKKSISSIDIIIELINLTQIKC